MKAVKDILKKYFGYDDFREGQEFLIDSIIEGNDAVGIMPTGAGKSICFQIPAMLLDGITLVISPLISLMKDQVNSLTQVGIKSAYINSSLTQVQYRLALENAINGMYKIIYIAPERLLSEDFLNFTQKTKISMVTVDEAHCISQWGQDFRPSYMKITEFINTLKIRPIVSAFTATATDEVRLDIIAMLKLNEPKVLVSGFDRKNLSFEVQTPKDKFSALITFLKDKKNKTGIIYCSTRKTVEEVCDKLCKAGYSTTRYHAGLSDNERKDNQEDFIFDKVRIIVATNAFGMGIDKSDVSFVVHYNMPKNIESYYQEAGRAGRDGSAAACILFYSGADVRTNLFLIESSKDAEYPDKATEALIKQRDRLRLREMTFYCHTKDCLRSYILNYFGEKTLNFCGNCGSCNSNFESVDITSEAQKILSCIKRVGERYGIKMIIDILRGSKNEKIIRLGLDKLSTYNIMDNIKEKRIRDIINFLVLGEYIEITNDEYPVAKLGEKAGLILFKGEKLQMKLVKEVEDVEEVVLKPKKHIIAGKEINPAFLDKLKELRIGIATEQKVPAFVIFSDATLIDMCIRLPKDNDEFLDVSGVGQVKLERYGEKFLNIINSFLSEATTTEKTVIKTNITDEKDLEELLEYLISQKNNIQFSDEPITISMFCDIINSVILLKYIDKLNAVKVSNWLTENEYLKILTDDEGKNCRVTSQKGLETGISTIQKKGKDDSLYLMNYYNKIAQEFLFSNIDKFIMNKIKKK